MSSKEFLRRCADQEISQALLNRWSEKNKTDPIQQVHDERIRSSTHTLSSWFVVSAIAGCFIGPFVIMNVNHPMSAFWITMWLGTSCFFGALFALMMHNSPSDPVFGSALERFCKITKRDLADLAKLKDVELADLACDTLVNLAMAVVRLQQEPTENPIVAVAKENFKKAHIVFMEFDLVPPTWGSYFKIAEERLKAA